MKLIFTYFHIIVGWVNEYIVPQLDNFVCYSTHVAIDLKRETFKKLLFSKMAAYLT